MILSEITIMFFYIKISLMINIFIKKYNNFTVFSNYDNSNCVSCTVNHRIQQSRTNIYAVIQTQSHTVQIPAQTCLQGSYCAVTLSVSGQQMFLRDVCAQADILYCSLTTNGRNLHNKIHSVVHTDAISIIVFNCLTNHSEQQFLKLPVQHPYKAVSQ